MVGPAFHGYTTSIGRALEHLGHDVTVHEYDRQAGVRDKMRTKVGSELPQRLGLRDGPTGTRRATQDAIDVLRAKRPDVVLAIKADALSPAFWVEARGQGALSHLWLYDELRRMTLDPTVLDGVDLVTSYSRLDAADLSARGRPASHLANAFDTTTPVRAVRSAPASEVLFIGARYPNRERLLLELHGRGLPVRAIGRDWSHHLVDRVRTWDVRRPALPSGRDVDRSTSYGLMAGSLANLNVHHDQDGFTMRTFEIPGSGGVQLIDREDVSQYYDPGTEVLVYRDVDEAEALVRRVTRDPGWAHRVAEAGRARTLAQHTFIHRARTLEQLWTG